MSARRITSLAWLSAIAAGLILFAACGGGGTNYNSGANSTPGSTASASGSTVNVALKEWMLTPDKTSAPAGNVTFSATNGGTVDHEFVVIKTDRPADSLTLSADAVDEAASGQTKVDEIAEFSPRTTKTLTLSLSAGKYVLICNVAGHYQRGVRSAFTVTAASSGRNY